MKASTMEFKNFFTENFFNCHWLFHKWEWKHPWWSLFSQNESLKCENHVKVDSFMDLLVENLPKFIHRVTISQKKHMDAMLQVLSTHQHPHKYLLQSKRLRSSKYFNYNLALTEILKIIKRHLVKTTFK